MDTFSFLETTAEISIAFTALVSIFSVLARRAGSFAPLTEFMIRNLLIASTASLFLAALPLVLSALGVSGSALWRVSSAAFLLVSLGATLWVVRNVRRFNLRLNTASARIATLLNLLALLAPLSNITGWPLSPNAGLHLASIWLLLGIASVNFLNLVAEQILSEPPA